MKKIIKKILRSFNIQINEYPNKDLKRRLQIIEYCKIDTLFDIGANNGLYAKKMRELGYDKKIISFEPLTNAFKDLKKASIKDNNWIINNYAIGDKNTSGIINISSNSQSSSILNMLPKHIEGAPNSKYIAKQEIEIKKLDSVFNSFTESNNVMIKVDTQGYEKAVIDGALNSLPKIKVIQLEMSVVPLYENEMLFIQMIDYLKKIGFQLYSLENGFSNKTTGQLLQVDGVFVKDNHIF